jgi:hypothetical protein
MILDRARAPLDGLKAWLVELQGRTGWAKVRGYSLVAGVLVLFGGLLAFLYNQVFLPHNLLNPASEATLSATPREPQEAKDIPGPINGVFFTASEAKTWQNRHPLAVVIENQIDARPQNGLASADAVYEALAEGGITRYLAMYLTNSSPITVGPIRSVRTYFLDWLEEYDGLAAHVGGNMDALDRIGPEGVKDLDQFYLGATYERSGDRLAPHNVYTNTDRLWAAATKKGYTGAAQFRSWLFKNEATPSARPSQQLLRLGFLGSSSYKVSWTYDQASNQYLRTVGGVDDLDRNSNSRVAAKTVVVEVIPMQTGLTRINEQTIIMNDTGAGKAYVFTDGVVTEGTWSKKSRTDRTTFWDKNDKEIPFNRGPIWIEVIPPNTAIEF